ncbi:MAG: SDR family oxidoreductase [Acidimicrobiia bacterium]|nr:SDR family oxidoreductase [Acidimicrobiia bacterium]NNL28964.1 SDR family oxidoreductase [Acidimicrobiia bacterium]
MRVIVTGGAAGIGARIVNAFQSNGSEVGVVDLEEAPHAQVGVTADARDHETFDLAIGELIDRLGGVDVFVNNLGVSGKIGGMDSVDPGAMRTTLDVNVIAATVAAGRCVRHMVRGSSIINIVSTAGIFGYPNRTPYVASKWALVGLTKTWAMELGERGIKVNAICPGTVDGPRMDRVISAEAAVTGRTESSIRDAYLNQTSMHTFITGDEIGDLAVFLANAPHISGQIISVDGHAETLRTS